MDTILKESGVIDEINHKEGAHGWFYKLKIANRTYNIFEKNLQTNKTIEAFTQLEAKQFKTGEAVDFDYTEYTSGDTTYKNLIKLTKMDGDQAKEVTQKAVETRDKTGTQIVRMNALTNSIGFFELNKEVVAFNLKQLPAESQMVSEETVLKLAEKFEKWVRR